MRVALVFLPDQYTLIDFGGGRRLERFGEQLLDRPCAAADRRPMASPGRWRHATARYDRSEQGVGAWSPPGSLPAQWTVRHAEWVLELRPTPFGHIGLFPEQAENWDWLVAHVPPRGPRFKLLNLFAYTGGSTLAAASAGAEVTHVDAAKNVVAWARHNAALSGLADAPIRWITDDAVAFASRELRRGRSYDGVILDPPSYGHGPKGQPWKIERDLEPLLAVCGDLMHRQPQLVLLTCHTPSLEAADLRRLLGRTCADRPKRIEARPLAPRAIDGRQFPSGLVARFSSVGEKRVRTHVPGTGPPGASYK